MKNSFRIALSFVQGAGAGVLECVTYGASNSLDSKFARSSQKAYLIGKMIGNLAIGIPSAIGSAGAAAGGIALSWTGVGAIACGSVSVCYGTIAVSSAAALSANLMKFAKTAKKSGKETASDAPSWAKSKKPNNGETADKFTTRILNEKYGKGNWKTGARSEYNQIKKYATRKLGLK